jgi:hypothetical protein
MQRSTLMAVGCAALAAIVPIGAAGAAKPTKPTVTLQPSATVVTFGQNDTLVGQVTGRGAGIAVELQQEPAPYTTGFNSLASANTDSQGRFSFFVKRPALNSRYRVVARARPTATSPEVTVRVRFKVTLRLSDTTPSRGQRVRFSGRTAPRHDGAAVAIQRRTASGRWRTIRTALLKHAAGDFSTYSTRIRIRASGVFRARVPGDQLHATGTSGRKLARVH